MAPTEHIDGKTCWAGVVGWPVSHSLSPAIHNRWCHIHGINAVYLPLPVMPDYLPQVIGALPQMGCVGFNLTIPHKEHVLKSLDGLSETAARIGAVNTVTLRDGKLFGHNTDAYGFWASIAASAKEVKKKNAFVIGAGGAARAVVASLDEAGFDTIYVMNRTSEKTEALKQLSPKVVAAAWAEAPEVLSNCDLLVNTTSLGMQGQPPLELALAGLPSHAVVTDIVYAPLETPLLKSAKQRGLHTVDGLGMLLYQAQKAFELWFGVLPEVDPKMRQFVEGMLK